MVRQRLRRGLILDALFFALLAHLALTHQLVPAPPRGPPRGGACIEENHGGAAVRPGHPRAGAAKRGRLAGRRRVGLAGLARIPKQASDLSSLPSSSSLPH